MRQSILTHQFVEHVPDELQEGIIYVSVPFATAIHKCCCGCGQEVVTPFTPTDWKLIYDGEAVSLYPSIGNWSLPCKSHYWIQRNRVHWAGRWSRDEINAARTNDVAVKHAYFRDGAIPSVHDQVPRDQNVAPNRTRRGVFRWIGTRLQSLFSGR